MKRIYLLIISGIAMYSSCTQNTKPADTSTIENTITQVNANAELKVSVEGMTCTGCKKMIEKQLSKMKGVESCTVDFENKQATIKYDNKVVNETAILAEFSKVGEGHYKASKLSDAAIK